MESTVPIHSSPLYTLPTEPLIQEEPTHAIRKFQLLMQEFVHLVHANRRELCRLADDSKQDYMLKTEGIKGLMDSKGWTGLEISMAAAGLATLAAFAPHLDSTSLEIKEFFDSIGGVDTVKKLLDTSSQFAEGSKPVFTTWSDAKLTPEHSAKEFIENNWRQTLEAVRQNKEYIPSLLHIVEKVMDEWSETGYN